MTSLKDTYEYCEQLINKDIDKLFEQINKWDGETNSFVDLKKQELKDLYEHLENIQNMKNSYISGQEKEQIKQNLKLSLKNYD